MKNRYLARFSVALATATATTLTSGYAHAGAPLPDPADFTLKVSPSITPPAMSGGEVFYLVKSNGKWSTSSKAEDLSQPNVERVRLDPWKATIWLDASLPKTPSPAEQKRGVGRDGRYECYVGLLATAERSTDSYNVCGSSFIKGDTSAGEAIIGGLSALLGSPRKMVVVDVAALSAALQESDAASLVLEARKKYSAQWLAEYRTRFEAAKSVSQLEFFLNLTKVADPDNLAPRAAERLAAAKQEAAERQQRLATEAQERRAQEEASRLAWAKALNVGDETFCGPVVEVRPPMVRIAVRPQLAGYSNDQWLRYTEVHRPEKGCVNSNGNLTPYR